MARLATACASSVAQRALSLEQRVAAANAARELAAHGGADVRQSLFDAGLVPRLLSILVVWLRQGAAGGDQEPVATPSMPRKSLGSGPSPPLPPKPSRMSGARLSAAGDDSSSGSEDESSVPRSRFERPTRLAINDAKPKRSR